MASGNLESMFPAATREYVQFVEDLWNDAAIQATYNRRNELEMLPRAATYFLNRVRPCSMIILILAVVLFSFLFCPVLINFLGYYVVLMNLDRIAEISYSEFSLLCRPLRFRGRIMSPPTRISCMRRVSAHQTV